MKANSTNITPMKALALILLGSVLVVGGILVNKNIGQTKSVFADPTNYSLVLGERNGQITAGSYSNGTVSTATTSDGNHIEIAYEQVMKSTTTGYKYAQLKASAGLLYNTDTLDASNLIYPLNNIASISVNFKFSSDSGASARLYYGNTMNPTGASDSYVNLTSDTLITEIAGYSYFAIKVTGTRAVYINTITINYSCDGTSGGEEPPLPATLDSIELSDTVSSYSVGDVFASTNGLVVKAHYSDSSVQNIVSGYTINAIGFNAYSAFSSAATYQVSVTYQDVTSNTINILVENVAPILPSDITISPKTLTLEVGESSVLSYQLTPNDIADEVTWISSTPSVASVNNGTVTALTSGNTIITVRTSNGLSDTCAITVNASEEEAPVSEIAGTYSLVNDVNELSIGDRVIIAATYNSSAYALSTSQGGNNRSATTTTIVSDTITIEESSDIESLVLKEGNIANTYSFYDESEDGYLYAASSSKNYLRTQSSIDDNASFDIAISSGVATIEAQGTNTRNQIKFNYNSGSPIFSCYSSGQTAVSLYRKASEPIYATSLALNPTSMNLATGETSTAILTTFTPSNTNQKTIAWTSQNSGVATVSSTGQVTGVAPGSTNIVATYQTSSSTTATARCSVMVNNIGVTNVSLNITSKSLNVGETYQLIATITPNNATNKNVSYSTSNSSVVSVSSSGLVSAIGAGNANVTVTTQDGSRTASCSFSVSEAPAVTKTNIQKTYTDYVDNNWYGIDNCPSIDSPKLLIVPVWFTDSSTYIRNNTNKTNVLNDIRAAYIGTIAETGWHSVKSYYAAESHGNVNLEATVTSWYECGQASSAFYSDTSGADATTNLVTSAANWYFSNNPSDSRQNYDTDGDGYLDGVMLIYGSPDYSALNKSSSQAGNMWAYCFWLQNNDASYSNPKPNVFFWASYDFMYNRSTASSRAGSTYYSGDTSNCTIDAHTYIHEMGHVFGLDDYYDYSDSNYSPAGGFSMQDYNVGSHDPYSVMALGWADPYIPTTSCTIEISPFQSSGDLILLTPSWNTYNSPFDEYLLLELYTPTGLNKFDSDYTYDGSYPRGPSAIGIRLWHVDARLLYGSASSFSASKITTNPSISSGRVYHMMSNTYDDPDYGSPLGSSYYNFNILQLIRNNTSATYTPSDKLSASSLFQNGSSFNPTTFARQFVKTNGKLNSDIALGWTFSVSISGSGESARASISLTRA